MTRDTRTEAQRRAATGLVRLTVRLPAEALRKLRELADDSGFTLAEQVQALVDCEYDEWMDVLAKMDSGGK